jgi:hypothetical protein
MGTSHFKVGMFTYIHGCLGSLLGTKVLIQNHDLKLAYFVIPSYLHVNFEMLKVLRSSLPMLKVVLKKLKVRMKMCIVL